MIPYKPLIQLLIPNSRLPLSGIKWALHSASATIKYMRIDHRRLYIFVAKQLLHSPNVIALLQQVSGKTMSKSMATPVLEYMSFAHCRSDGFLHGRF